MKLYFVTLYLVSGFFMFALQASTLDAPTLVVQEYSKYVGTTGSAVDEERGILSYLNKHMTDLPQAKAHRLTKLILKLAHQHRLPPGLILSIIRVESNFRPWAVSSRGALGLMQLMPETAEWVAGRHGMRWDGPAVLLDEEQNITYGIRYLAYLKDKYENDLKKMLCAYNQGPAKVDEDVSEGRNLTLEYYHKIRQYLPILALGQKQVRNRNVD